MSTEHFKQKLQEELKVVEEELKTVGRKNPDVAEDWEAQVKDTDSASTESDEKADKFEEYEQNAAILNPLELRWRDIKRALRKIEDGTYGTCEISGDKIEEERLQANPAARTCEKHLDEEKNLPL